MKAGEIRSGFSDHENAGTYNLVPSVKPLRSFWLHWQHFNSALSVVSAR